MSTVQQSTTTATLRRYKMKAVKIYDQEDNRTIGIFTDGKKFTAMTYSQSKDFKTFKAADKWLQKYL